MLIPRLFSTQERARDSSRAVAVNQIAQSFALMLVDEVTLDTSIDDEWEESWASAQTLSSNHIRSLPIDPSDVSINLWGCTTPWEYCIANLWSRFLIFAISEWTRWNCTVIEANLLWESTPWYLEPTTWLLNGDHQCAFIK